MISNNLHLFELNYIFHEKFKAKLPASRSRNAIEKIPIKISIYSAAPKI